MAIAVGTLVPVADFPIPGWPDKNMVAERVTITGSTGAVNDTVAITPKFVKQPLGAIGGPFSRTMTATTITLKALAALGNDSVDVIIFGRA